MGITEKKLQDTGELHNKVLHDFHFSPHIIWVIKWKRTGWAWYVESTGLRRNAYRILVGKPEGNIPLEGLGVHGSIILIWAFKKQCRRMWNELMWFRTGTSRGLS